MKASKRIMVRKVAAAAGAVLVLLFAGGVLAEPQPAAPAPEEPSADFSAEGLQPVGGSDRLRLYLELETLTLTVEDTLTGCVWRSAPEGREEDGIAQGSTPGDMESLLTVRYIDEADVAGSVNAKVGSINKDTYVVKTLSNGSGFVVEFQFLRKKEGFTIPLRVTAEGDTLRAEIQFDKIVENGPARITEVSLLPYFGAGNREEEGFSLLPDGSGAIIDFQDTKQWATPYRERVYGGDSSLTQTGLAGAREKIRLPVFGIGKEKGAFIGILDGCDTMAYIEAAAPGSLSSYTPVYPTFIYRQTDTALIADNQWNERQVPVTAREVTGENPVVLYRFTQPGGGLADMAALYRQTLMAGTRLARLPESGDMPLLLEVFGVTQMKDSILGVITDRKITATVFDDVSRMVEQLRGEGVEKTRPLLYGFLKGGLYYADPDEGEFDGLAGGNAGFRALAETAEAGGIRLYTAADIGSVYQPTWRLSANRLAPKRLDNSNALQADFLVSTLNKDEDTEWFSIKPTRLMDAYNRFSRDFGGKTGLALLALGDTLYADYNDKSATPLPEAKRLVQQVLEKAASEQEGLLVEGGNAYALPYASGVVEAPMRSSRYDLTTRDVPFYQMALRGLVELAGIPENCQGEDSFLRAMETGSLLNYRVTGESPEIYRESRLKFLYNTSIDALAPEIVRQYAALNQIYRGMQGAFITDYRFDGDISVTVYDNGTAVAVNRGKTDGSIDGQTVPAGGYTVIHG